MTESDQITDIHRSVGRIEGALEAFISEARSVWARDRVDARAQDDRINSASSEIAAVKASIALEAGHKAGHKEHRDFVGHVVTGVVAFGAMFAAMWSGVFHPTH